jgi:uncharacterized protein YecT (DUF1311 family)
MHMATLLSRVLMCALLSSTSIAFAQDAGMMEDALKNCDRDQQTMNFCARHHYDVADKSLNQVYRNSMKNLQDKSAQQRLRDAQRAWIVFRDKDCLAQTGPRETSGSIWPLQHFACMEQHTARRTEDLRQQACGMEGCR